MQQLRHHMLPQIHSITVGRRILNEHKYRNEDELCTYTADEVDMLDVDECRQDFGFEKLGAEDEGSDGGAQRQLGRAIHENE